MKIYPGLIADNNENFEGMSDGKYINVKKGAHLRVFNSPDAADIKFEVLKGVVELQEFSHATGTGYCENNKDVATVKDITGNINMTPAQGKRLVYVATTAHRTLTPVNADYTPGFEHVICNNGGTYNLIFDPTGINVTITPGVVKRFFYTGAAWKDIS